MKEEGQVFNKAMHVGAKTKTGHKLLHYLHCVRPWERSIENVPITIRKFKILVIRDNYQKVSLYDTHSAYDDDFGELRNNDEPLDWWDVWMVGNISQEAEMHFKCSSCRKLPSNANPKR